MRRLKRLAVAGFVTLVVFEAVGGGGRTLAGMASDAPGAFVDEVVRESSTLGATWGGQEHGGTPVGLSGRQAVPLPQVGATEKAHTATDSAPRVTRGRGSGSAVPVGPYSFTYLGTQPGGWDPCIPIPVVVNLKNAPAGALADVRTALAQINAASGLKFTVTGTTALPPNTDWGMDSRGSWKPVLVAWDQPGTNLVTGSEAGSTSTVAIVNGASKQIVSGMVEFNSTLNRYYRPGFGPGMYRGTLMLHEFGHLAGLDHVTDPQQVMYPVTQTASGLGSGDRAGLRILGQRRCTTAPTPAP